MQRIKALDPDTTTGKSKDYLMPFTNKLGMVPK